MLILTTSTPHRETRNVEEMRFGNLIIINYFIGFVKSATFLSSRGQSTAMIVRFVFWRWIIIALGRESVWGKTI